MKNFFKLSALAILAAAGALVITSVSPTIARAQEAAEQPAQTENQESENQEQAPTPAPAPAAYSYTAQTNDSYSKIARKAVQTYGFNKQVNLSLAQIIAAETYLAQSAGSPKLYVGQAISLNESDIDAAVKKAQGLNESQLKLWERYTAGVDFNTNNVGEARS